MLMLMLMHLLLDKSLVPPEGKGRSERPEEKMEGTPLYDFINKVQPGRSP